MGDLLIRNIDPDLKQRLTEQAKANGRSLSAEAAGMLAQALPAKPEKGLGTLLVELFRDCPIPNDYDMEVHDLVEPPIDFSERK